MRTNQLTRADKQPGRILLAGLWCFITMLPNAAAADSGHARSYQLTHRVNLDPESGTAQVTLSIAQERDLVRAVTFTMPDKRFLGIRSESSVERNGDQVIWHPGKTGGELHYSVDIEHRRGNNALDAQITQTWALLKLDHLFPAASARTLKGAHSIATLELSAPAGWSIETPYGWGIGKAFDIEDPQRRFDQPRGWMMAGELSVRRDRIDGRNISVASPLGTGFRANDTLAFLRWNLPGLIELFPSLPDRLLVVAGSSDMWRGGLSGRASLYLHPERPLVSGNRTSTLLHEMFHVASRFTSRNGADWIVEGLAEYYGLLLLFRSGGISEYRLQESLDTLASWSEGVACVATDRSQGRQTAAAAGVMRALDEEIQIRSGSTSSLDTIVHQLLDSGRTLSNEKFRSTAERVLGGPVKALADCP